MLKEFKEFALKGNVLDMAVGIVIGAAFGTIIGSLVADVIMPPIGLLLGNVDFSNLFLVLKEGKVAGPYASLAAAKAAGAVSMNVGVFINTVINFIILAFAVFLLVRSVNRMRRKEAGASACPSDKRLPPLFHGDFDQGHPLSSLHLRAEGCLKTAANGQRTCPRWTSSLPVFFDRPDPSWLQFNNSRTNSHKKISSPSAKGKKGGKDVSGDYL